MGQVITICNLTNLMINVSIGQVGPLYYENQMQPMHCMNRTVGRVWFTVTALQWHGVESEFSPLKLQNPNVKDKGLLKVVHHGILVKDGLRINIKGGPRRQNVPPLTTLAQGETISVHDNLEPIQNLIIEVDDSKVLK